MYVYHMDINFQGEPERAPNTQKTGAVYILYNNYYVIVHGKSGYNITLYYPKIYSRVKDISDQPCHDTVMFTGALKLPVRK